MKIRAGVNPDFCDFDEIDQDALDSVLEYEQGHLTFEELAAQIGPTAAAEMQARFFGDDPYFPELLDDPEDFGPPW